METAEMRAWLNGLAQEGVCFVPLLLNSKKPMKKWDVCLAIHECATVKERVRWATSQLKSGNGLGILLLEDLWCLDADSPEEMGRIIDICSERCTFPPWVRTPSGGAHFYFRLPGDFPRAGLKNHLCHPLDEDGQVAKVDFKFGPRSMMVAPGTRLKKGLYQPQCPWMPPPYVDPRLFLPGGQFWKQEEPYLVNPRSERDRMAAARQYLRTCAPVSRSGSRGRQALMNAAIHLVAYHRLDPEVAAHLLTSGDPSWNARCLDGHGKPYPWTHWEIFAACRSAVGAVPPAGVQAFKDAQARLDQRTSLGRFIEAMTRHMGAGPHPRTRVNDLRAAYNRHHQTQITAKAFGEALQRAGVPRRPHTKARTMAIEGLDLQAFLSSWGYEDHTVGQNPVIEPVVI